MTRYTLDHCRGIGAVHAYRTWLFARTTGGAGASRAAFVYFGGRRAVIPGRTGCLVRRARWTTHPQCAEDKGRPIGTVPPIIALDRLGLGGVPAHFTRFAIDRYGGVGTVRSLGARYARGAVNRAVVSGGAFVYDVGRRAVISSWTRPAGGAGPCRERRENHERGWQPHAPHNGIAAVCARANNKFI